MSRQPEAARAEAVRVEVVRGDITTQDVDVVVNAANRSLLGGGGVDGAIHRAAGPALLAECRDLRAGRLPDGLPTGEAVATGAGDLPARWVVHTVGPDARRGQHDPRLLRSAFASALAVADSLGARSVAVPAVSAGVYGWAAADVAREAVAAVRALTPVSLELVRLVLFSERLEQAFTAALADG